MRKTWKRFVRGITAGTIIVYYWLFYFFRYSNHPERYPIEKRYALVRKAARRITHWLRGEVFLEGKEEFVEASKLENGTLIVCNHISIFDVVQMIVNCDRRISFIGKKELYKTPIFGRCLRSIDGIFLDRNDPRQAIEVLRQSTEYLSEGGMLVIYPEGTRNKKPLETSPADFHAGSFKCALRAKANILPACGFGTFRYLDGATFYKSNPVYNRFLTLIPYSEIEGKSTAELASLCHDRISENVEDLKKLDNEYISSGRVKNKVSKWWEQPYFKETRK